MPVLPCLLPTPRQFELTGGSFKFTGKKLILLETPDPQALLFTATRLQTWLKEHAKLFYEIYAGMDTNMANVGITLRIQPEQGIPPQGYRINISPTGILLEATGEAGLFYAGCTLIQLLRYSSPPFHHKTELSTITLPCLVITDWPDFTNRGVMLDISRDKVPTMETLFDLVDLLASWKINQLQLYTEHTFAYQQHPEVWLGVSPITGEEILKLDAFCKERYIELVPNQNSFGHLEHWLSLPKYKPLAEAPDGFDFPWGHHEGPFSLYPLDKRSLSFLEGLYDELLPHFTSCQFNVGCDETFDLGQGRSKEECERVGSGRVYLDFLLKIYEQVRRRGFRMQFWGDIIMAHPDLVPELPKDSIALEWGYEADHPFDEHGEKFAQAGLAFYVCPGTSAWNSIAGRTDNCLGNLANAALNGMKHGAEGYLITDWGDNGHWQNLPVSYLGFAAGAAYSWCYQSNQGLDVQSALNLYAFQDVQGVMGNLAYDLGNIYHLVGPKPPNYSALFYFFQHPMSEWGQAFDKQAGVQLFHDILERIDRLGSNILSSNSQRKDKLLLLSEFNLSVSMLMHACKRGLCLYGSNEYTRSYLADDLKKITKEFRRIWLKRYRPGGLHDSLAFFDIPAKDYH
jgi:hexosaminidase